MNYAIVIERGPTSYGATVPDVPGCAAVGETEAAARALLRDAIAAHLDALRRAGHPVPEPRTTVD